MSDEEFTTAVKESISIRQVLLKMGLRPAGGNYQTVHRRIAALKLDTSHFLGMGHLKGRPNPWARKIPLADILVVGASWRGTTDHLKKRLLKAGLLEHRCAGCTLTEWRGGPIPLELEHRNGDRSDNRVSNLCLLCPNCHALTPTYRAKNVRTCRERRAQVVESGDTGALNAPSP